jgi:hypothetical protein
MLAKIWLCTVFGERLSTAASARVVCDGCARSAAQTSCSAFVRRSATPRSFARDSPKRRSAISACRSRSQSLAASFSYNQVRIETSIALSLSTFLESRAFFAGVFLAPPERAAIAAGGDGRCCRVPRASAATICETANARSTGALPSHAKFAAQGVESLRQRVPGRGVRSPRQIRRRRSGGVPPTGPHRTGHAGRSLPARPRLSPGRIRGPDFANQPATLAG